MALNASLDSLLFGLNIMGNKQGIVDLCMALDASYTFKMQALGRQPTMLIEDVRVFQAREQLVF